MLGKHPTMNVLIPMKGNFFVWDYASCYALAKKCHKKRDLKEASTQAMRLARKNGWLKDYIWFETTESLNRRPRPARVKWPFERVQQIAKRYTTLAQFTKENKIASAVARRNGWLDKFTWLGRSLNPFDNRMDNVYAYVFKDTKSVYVGRTIHLQDRDYSHRNSSDSPVYKHAKINCIEIPKMTVLNTNESLEDGLFKEDLYVQEFKLLGWNVLNKAKTGIKSGSLGLIRDGKWNEATCYAEARKYTRYIDFERCSASAYNKALKNGWTKQYTWLKRRIILPRKPANPKKFIYDFDKCYELAKRCNTFSKFKDRYPGAFKASLTNEWIDQFFWLNRKQEFRWTKELCLKEAKKYTKYRDFATKSRSAYNAARANGWIDDYTWLVKKDISQRPVLQYTPDGKFVNRYNGVREAARILGLKTYSGIIGVCNGLHAKCHGFVWKYG